MTAEPEWTFEDEAQLASLQERKETWEANKRRKLERLLEDVFYHGISFDDVANDMIEKADRYIEALQPYTTVQAIIEDFTTNQKDRQR